MAQYHPDPEINQAVLDLLEKIKKYCESQTGEKEKDLTYLILVSTIPDAKIILSENGIPYTFPMSDLLLAIKFALRRRDMFFAASLEKKHKEKNPEK